MSIEYINRLADKVRGTVAEERYFRAEIQIDALCEPAETDPHVATIIAPGSRIEVGPLLSRPCDKSWADYKTNYNHLLGLHAVEEVRGD